MGFKTILIKKEDGIFTITLNRPDAKNALNRAAFCELHDAVEESDHDEEVKIVLITGAGKEAFCSGRDLKEYASSSV